MPSTRLHALSMTRCHEAGKLHVGSIAHVHMASSMSLSLHHYALPRQSVAHLQHATACVAFQRSVCRPQPYALAASESGSSNLPPASAAPQAGSPVQAGGAARSADAQLPGTASSRQALAQTIHQLHTRPATLTARQRLALDAEFKRGVASPEQLIQLARQSMARTKPGTCEWSTASARRRKSNKTPAGGAAAKRSARLQHSAAVGTPEGRRVQQGTPTLQHSHRCLQPAAAGAKPNAHVAAGARAARPGSSSTRPRESCTSSTELWNRPEVQAVHHSVPSQDANMPAAHVLDNGAVHGGARQAAQSAQDTLVVPGQPGGVPPSEGAALQRTLENSLAHECAAATENTKIACEAHGAEAAVQRLLGAMEHLTEVCLSCLICPFGAVGVPMMLLLPLLLLLPLALLDLTSSACLLLCNRSACVRKCFAILQQIKWLAMHATSVNTPQHCVCLQMLEEAHAHRHATACHLHAPPVEYCTPLGMPQLDEHPSRAEQKAMSLDSASDAICCDHPAPGSCQSEQDAQADSQPRCCMPDHLHEHLARATELVDEAQAATEAIGTVVSCNDMFQPWYGTGKAADGDATAALESRQTRNRKLAALAQRPRGGHTTAATASAQAGTAVAQRQRQRSSTGALPTAPSKRGPPARRPQSAQHTTLRTAPWRKLDTVRASPHFATVPHLETTMLRAGRMSPRVGSWALRSGPTALTVTRSLPASRCSAAAGKLGDAGLQARAARVEASLARMRSIQLQVCAVIACL